MNEWLLELGPPRKWLVGGLLSQVGADLGGTLVIGGMLLHQLVVHREELIDLLLHL